MTEILKNIYLKLAYSKDAQEVLDILAMSLQSNINLSSAVNEFYTLTTNKKQKVILKELQKSISAGRDIDGLRYFFSSEEMTILKTYYKTGDLKSGIDIVMRIRKIKKTAKSQILSSSAAPLINLIATIGAIKYTNIQLIPAITQSGITEEQIYGMSPLFHLSVLITSTPVILFTLILTIASIVGFIFITQNVTGNVRKKIDRIPPFTIYRLFIGTVYLYSIAKLIMVNNAIKDAVRIAAGDNKYLKYVAREVSRVLEDKGSLGVAMSITKWILPDERAVNFIRLIETKEGFKERLNMLAEEYMNSFETKITKMLSTYRNMADTVSIVIMMLYILGSLQLTNNLSTFLSTQGHF